MDVKLVSDCYYLGTYSYYLLFLLCSLGSCLLWALSLLALAFCGLLFGGLRAWCFSVANLVCRLHELQIEMVAELVLLLPGSVGSYRILLVAAAVAAG